MQPMNVFNEEGKNKYKNVMFTDKGYETLHQHLKELVRLYLDDGELGGKPRVYPLRLGLVLGMPLMKYYLVIPNKDAHYERIISFAMVLGLDSIKVQLPNGSFAELKIGDTQ